MPRSDVETTIVHRLVLLTTCLLAAWHVAVGITSTVLVPMIAYTIAFGVILIACLLLLILGLDILDNPIVVIVSTLIPLSLSLGLVWEYFSSIRIVYLVFAILGFLAIVITRLIAMPNKLPVIFLAVVHGVAGLTIFLLPLFLSITGRMPPGFSQVGVGGALIGIGGLLLAFLKTGIPLISRKTILQLLPIILLLMTLAFIAGFHYAG